MIFMDFSSWSFFFTFSRCLSNSGLEKFFGSIRFCAIRQQVQICLHEICVVRAICKFNLFRLIRDVNMSFVCTISLALVCGRSRCGMFAFEFFGQHLTRRKFLLEVQVVIFDSLHSILSQKRLFHCSSLTFEKLNTYSPEEFLQMPSGARRKRLKLSDVL